MLTEPCISVDKYHLIMSYYAFFYNARFHFLTFLELLTYTFCFCGLFLSSFDIRIMLG